MRYEKAEHDILKAPEVPRKFKMWWHQWIGLPLILAIPMLALIGVIGDASKKATSVSDSLEITANFPTKLHYGKMEEMQIAVRNISSSPLTGVTVEIDPNYLKRFSGVQVSPPPTGNNKIEIGKLNPGATSEITVELGGEKYGAHSGSIEAKANETQVARVNLSSFVFP